METSTHSWDLSSYSSGSYENGGLESPAFVRQPPQFFLQPFSTASFASFIGIAYLEGQIDLRKAAQIFPILKEPELGNIYNIKYKDVIRGEPANEAKMSNMMGIRIMLPDEQNNRNLYYINLGPHSLHIPGVKSKFLVQQAAYWLTRNLMVLQEQLCRYSLEIHRQVASWLAQATRGDVIFSQYHNGDGSISTNIKAELRAISSIPENLPQELVTIYQRPLSYLHDWDSYCQFLAEFCQSPIVYSGSLQMNALYTTNYMYNYGLGFPVNRRILAERLNGLNGLKAAYNNTVRGYVQVILECPGWKSPFIQKKTRGPIKHTFNVTANGKVTQTSPTGELAEEGYNIFMHSLRQVYSL